MDNRPIGVFDSGLGGLTAVKALRRLLPGEDLIYFGDTARVPYGGRSRETLLKYARQDIAFLRSFDLKAVLIACGTVTSTSLDTLRKENDLPVLGVVEPSCREALAVTKNKKIGMIATLASARSGAYERTLKGLDADVQVSFVQAPVAALTARAGSTSATSAISSAASSAAASSVSASANKRASASGALSNTLIPMSLIMRMMSSTCSGSEISSGRWSLTSA